MDEAASSPVPAAPLPYADLPSRWGVSLDRSSTGVRITIPPVPGWRALGKGFHIGMAVLLAVIIYIGVVTVPRGEYTAFLPNLVIYGIAFAAVALFARERLRRRMLIEVTAERLSLAYMTRGHVARRWSWPRSAVNEVKVNQFNGKLLIRVVGKDVIEVYVGPYVQVAPWLAQTISTALGGQFEPSEHAPADVVSTIRPVWRTTLLTAGTVLSIGGLGMCLYPWPGRGLGLYALIAAGVPFAMVYGSQDREFYL